MNKPDSNRLKKILIRVAIACAATLAIVFLGLAVAVWVLVSREKAMAARRAEIAADWSNPTVDLYCLSHSYNADHSKLLVWYSYQVSQTAPLKYPYFAWKGTAWQSKIDSRKHVVAHGRDLVVLDIGTKALSFPELAVPPSLYPRLADATLNADDPALTIFASGQDFVTITRDRVCRVSPKLVETLFSVVAEHGAITDVTHRPTESRVLFCVRKNREVQCASLDLTSGAVTTLYTFNHHDRQPLAIQVAHLDPDPERTVIVLGSITRANNGTLGVGVNKPARVLAPESMVEGAPDYSWSMSRSQEELYLAFAEENAVWSLRLADSALSPSSLSVRALWAIPPQPNVQPSEWREPVNDHLVKTMLGVPDKRNMYPARTGKD